MKQCVVLSPTAILGYGFPLESFRRGLDRKPDVIAVDAGSVDPGPYYLGSGRSFTDRTMVKRDLVEMLRAGCNRNIPVIVGSSGGSGAAPHVAWLREIVLEIAQEERLSFRLATISAEIDRELIKKKIVKGQIEPLGGLPALTAEAVENSSYIVAQMGVEPFQEALSGGAQVILGGRAYDPSCFAALPMSLGLPAAYSLHMGKILECAAIAAEPGSGSDAVLGIVREDGFILEPLSAERRFTKQSTAAHSLYEKSDPFYLPGPGGALNLREVEFIEQDGGRVFVRGTKFEPTARLAVKLEGARRVGYRTVTIAGTRDPIMIRGIKEIIEAVQERVRLLLGTVSAGAQLYFHVYGKSGVMGALEPLREPVTHELGIVLEVVAPTQAQANTVCSVTRSTLLHYGYPGRISTAGNLAFPFSPSDLPAGEVYEFTIYHLMDAEGEVLFPVIYEEVGGV